MDERPRELEAFARQTRDLDVPPGARARVRAGVGRRLARRRRARLAVAVGAPALAAAAVIAYFAVGTGEPAGPVTIAAAEGVTRDGNSLEAGDRVAEGAVRIAEEGRLAASVGTGTVLATGPADLELARGRVSITHGEIEVDGRMHVAGPSCAADVDGRARVTAESTHTQVVVIAGSATASSPDVACRILSLEAPADDPAGARSGSPGAGTPDELAGAEGPDTAVAEPAGAEGPDTAAAEPAGAEGPDTAAAEPSVEGGPRADARRVARGHPAPTAAAPVAGVEGSTAPGIAPERVPQGETGADARPTEASEPSELAQQVEAYRAALALRGSDDAAALARLREMQRRWPRSPLAHEVDLGVVDALVRLERSAEARAEAGRFLRRHPSSPRASEIRAIAEANR